MFRIFRWLFLAILLLVAAVGLYWLFIRYYFNAYRQERLLSGLSGFSYLQIFSNPAPLKNIEVFGFLPYWTMQKAEIPPQVSDVAYFSVVFDSAGNIVERQDGETEMGFSRLQSETFTQWLAQQHADKKRIHITVVGTGNDDIAALVTNQNSRQNFIDNISQLLVSYPFDGLQLDFELAGTTSESVQAGYVTLLESLNKQLKQQSPDVILSVSVFGTAASKDTDFWDVEKLAPHVDRLIIMSYDYHVRSSDVAGPVAPLFGKETGRYEDDITSNIRDFLKYVPPEKILLGIPFYGYEWQVVNGEPGSATFPDSGATATYKRVQELLNDPNKKVEEGWDSAALSPFVVLNEGGVKKIIYYDNPRSLSYKLDLVAQLKLRGVAIWALGYEGDQTELWEVIQQKLLDSQSE